MPENICGARYPGGDRAARIVRCDLDPGHDGDHEETDTGSTWPQAAGSTPTVRSARPPRRRAVLAVSSEVIAQLLGLPDDVTIVGFQLDHLSDSINFLVEGERFEPVEPGTTPLHVWPRVTTDERGRAVLHLEP